MLKPTRLRRRTEARSTPVNPFLKDVVRSFRLTIGAVFVFSFFLNLLALTVPIYLLQIYDKVLPNQNVDTLLFLTMIVFVAVLALGFLESVRRTLLAKLGVRFDNRVSEHLLNSSIHRAIAKSYPSVNVMRDLSSLRNFFSGSSMFPILDVPWTPMFVLILYLLHPLLGLFAVVGCVLLFSLALANEYLTRDGVIDSSNRGKEMMDTASAHVRNADVVQAMGMQSTILAEWKQQNAETLSQAYRVGRINTRLLTVSKMLRMLLQVGIIFTAAWLILQSQLTAGATLASLLLLRRAISPLEQSIRSWKSVLKARNSFRNISEYLDHATSLDADRSMPEPKGSLVAEKISYRRSGEKRAVFSRLSLAVAPGKICVLTGATAAGKSTLMRVLAGIVPPTSGRVMLGGYELGQYTAEQLGPYIGYLPQDVGLFPGTVRDNISRLKDAPIESVVEAAQLARAHKLIQELPDGYDTMLAEDGSNLSGGQRQRIGLARALFGNAKLVLLDEPDANLDSKGRSVLRKTLRQLRKNGVAVLVISHQPSVLKIADIRYELQDGKITVPLPEEPAEKTASDKTTTSNSTSNSISEETTANKPAVDKPKTSPTRLVAVDSGRPRVTKSVAEQSADTSQSNEATSSESTESITASSNPALTESTSTESASAESASIETTKNIINTETQSAAQEHAETENAPELDSTNNENTAAESRDQLDLNKERIEKKLRRITSLVNTGD